MGGIATVIYVLFFYEKAGKEGAVMTPLVLTADRSGERVDQFLARQLPELTRSSAQRLIEEGALTLAGPGGQKKLQGTGGGGLYPGPPRSNPVGCAP